MCAFENAFSYFVSRHGLCLCHSPRYVSRPEGGQRRLSVTVLRGLFWSGVLQ